MDQLKEKVEQIVKKIKSDKTFAKKFKTNPIGAVESVLGIDLPDDQINKIVETVKAKIKVDNVSGLLNQVKDVFNKK